MTIPKTPGSFVARIWLEGERGTEQVWRGRIQHVQGEEETYFETLMEMREFIEQISGVPMLTGEEAGGTG
ncbi:MAG: hypothetical protein HN725_10545 [Alphaproteobacteria bacterium]|jgi:hypothetical protein|nr:hypothetical protein [Alphaproteobacteria bacterium]MBT4084215.1 hypothetical protein [Alphaproteobacteria bacterium]MBT4543554.1 hypothetical protein [Alphaproteobacteria bacterium]MBT5919147.1 hypothetical protein [Alphaproteobacteria bacterium]MBT7745720.1 hypothetical protein [Alphaproteobacteria bacterium]